MKIEKSNSYLKVEQIQKEKDFIPTVLDEIFLICKEDKSFLQNKKSIVIIDKQIDLLNQKILKQENLLKQAEKLRSSINEKVSVLDNDSFRIRARLLESLGSEI